jgi:poly-gamma-glutamate synthesis protein (capsule biosynthesis protein)
LHKDIPLPFRRQLRLANLLALAAVVPFAGGVAVGSSPPVTLAAVGDISIARGVSKQIARHGTAYPLAAVRSCLREADITYGNLECAVTARLPAARKSVTLVAPPGNLGALRGIPHLVLGLANNHTFDAGPRGAMDSASSLESVGISHVGLGPTAKGAMEPVILRIAGIKVAFLAFSEFVPPPSEVAAMSPATLANVRAAVANARRQADVVVAGFHWGIEYTPTPTAHQRALASAAVAAGADVVLGSHPHVLQPIERIPRPGRHPAIVAYSLGNFVFDATTIAGKRSALLLLRLDRLGAKSIRLVPITIKNSRPMAAARSNGRAHRVT